MVSVAIFASHCEHIVGARGERLVDLVRMLDDAGAHQVVFSEHVVLASEIEAHGPGGLPFPFPPDHNYPEPLIALAAAAGATSRIRLGTGILIAPMRPAVVLAKMAATLDVLSGGRLDLGLGAGWHGPELRAAGVDPAQAMQVLEDTVGACRALWAGGPVSFRSPTISFDGLNCYPQPLSGPDLPVWLAGPPTRANARRVARLADGWLPFSNLAPEAIAQGRRHIDEAAQQIGRDPESIGIRVGVSEPSAVAAAPYLAAGATQIQLPLARLATDFASAREVTERAVAELTRP